MPRTPLPSFAFFAEGAASVLCGTKPAPLLAAALATLLVAGASEACGVEMRVSAPSGRLLADASVSVPEASGFYAVAEARAARPPTDEIVATAAAAVSDAMASDEAGEAFLAAYEAVSRDCARNASVPARCLLKAPGVSFDFASGRYVVGRGDAPAGPDGIPGIGTVVAADVDGRFVLKDASWVEMRSGGEAGAWPEEAAAF